MRDLIYKPAAWIIAACIVVVAILYFTDALTSGKRAKVEAQLNKNQAGAALESGKDAVGVVGSAAERASTADQITQENRDAIKNAPGADAPVDPRARDVGLRSLCKRAAYRERPECLQHAPAR